ncbi:MULTISPECIES: hypothetical protein [Gluconobacter]|uniref:Major facilitator superfamily (MFS) profile domain-containing protein n=1 Tax=Gluconobacter oxydans TaxID=442 RepID=A0AB35ANS1_GLUOY|nr:hypothetical protein [Gluconobacter oxydans]MBF0856580.1 hypothetical protein [Gluconobacter oxydans]TCW25534.1 hypothetical protein EDC20_1133 [Gluconobacter oxydans]
MNRAQIIFLFVLLMTGLTIGVYASLASYPPAVPAALQSCRYLVLAGETAGIVLIYFVLGFLLYAVNNGYASAASAAAVVAVLGAGGYGLYYLVSTPGLLS